MKTYVYFKQTKSCVCPVQLTLAVGLSEQLTARMDFQHCQLPTNIG